MKASLRWLRDYAPLDAPVDMIVRTLTETGSEVGAVAEAAAGIIVARVLQLEPMPGSSHGLLLADLDIGPQPPRALVDLGVATSPLRVVTGAPNLRAGDLVPYAPPGTRPPAMEEALGVRTYRGKFQSPGMLCSAADLGGGDDAAGILVLDHGVPGQPLREALDMDVVLDVEVTTNRPDCLCHLGLARELAAALGETLLEPDTAIPEERASAVAAEQRVRVRVDDVAGCRRFAARVIENVTMGPSPSWLQERLRAVGLRPINNVVDVTNFVAHELGQPMHAFDLDRVVAAAPDAGSADIVVRRAHDGEELTTLDGVRRTLSAADIVVCAGDRVISLAGVMGGSDTAVDAGSRNVLLEAASWDGVAVRATSGRLNLRTDASTLFEKGLSDTIPPVALDRGARLIAEGAGGHVLRGLVDAWPAPLPEIAPISVTAAQMSNVLGYAVDATEAATILAHLGFAVEQEGASLTAVPPHFRRDVTIREDVIEEVGRMLGYQRVPSTLPGRRTALRDPAPPAAPEDEVREACLGAGFDEAITYSFTSTDVARLIPGAAVARTPLALRNPLTEEWTVMRVSQLPGLCVALALNLNRGVSEPALFELGRVFWDGERATLAEGSVGDAVDHEAVPLPLEPLLLSVAAQSPGAAHHAGRTLRHLQSLLVRVAEDVAGARLTAEPAELHGMRRARSARLLSGGREVGMIGEVEPETAERLGLRGRVLVGELNLDGLAPRARQVPRFQAPARFPAVVQDVAVTVDGNQPAGPALDAVREAAGPSLETAELYDEYRGPHLGAGRKGWTFRLTYRAADRTLTSDEVQQVQQRIVDALTRHCGAELRQ